MNEVKLYRCNPEKNKDCPKTCCYLYGGECENTTEQRYAMEEVQHED